MLEIDGKIISLDILRCRFLCDVGKCRGMCCVEGNSGAPLEEEETVLLKSEFDAYRDYLTPEGLEAIGKEGFWVTDSDGDLTTTLVGEMECAYSTREGDVTMCAIEKAWKAGKTPFRKPVSCHLYPIRVARFSDGSYGLNYHRWNVCAPAVSRGQSTGTPVYKALREPLERRFGPEFYAALEEAERLLREETGE